MTQSSNKLRQIQEITLLKSLYPSLGQRIPKPLFFLDSPVQMTVRVSSVCGTLVREEIIDRNIFQYCSTEKRSQSLQRLQSR